MHTTIDEKQLLDFAKDLKVLYVEDDPKSREISLSMIGRFFNDIVVAEEGKEGLDKYTKTIDLVITDINMPKMSGLDMIEAIKGINSNVHCMIITSYDSIDNLIKSIELGVDGFIQKPMTLKYMKKNLLNVLERIYFHKQLDEHQKKLEQKLEIKLKELENKDQLFIKQSKHAAMGEMVDIIAHQWIQPLSLIGMHSDLLYELNEDKDCVDIKDVKETSNKIRKQINHLVDTLSHFRNFFRPHLNMENCNLLNIFNSIDILLKGVLIDNKIKLEINCDEKIVVQANENDLKHIFINLINNAIDQFRINNIKDRKITIDVKDEDKLTILVKDNAGGIKDEFKDSIFDANFTTKGNNEGTGMGLYMTSLILEKYNAAITIDNINGGAVFKVTI